MASLSLKHIYKIYPSREKVSLFKKIFKKGKYEEPKDVIAVNDFSMDIKDGEFIVFVGPSGCGKSTTLRMIAGLEDISAGELYIDDKLMNNVEPMNRDIAMVFQSYALYPHMNVYDNIAFSLKLRKVEERVTLEDGTEKTIYRHLTKDEIDEKVHWAADILGINDLLNRKPSQMSGGQCQRVALGRAMVRGPKVFLFDEPLSNLDAKLRASMRSEIVKLHNSIKSTFIYVTHDQIEAMTMGTRIVVMKDGFIQQIDTPTNLFNYPTNMFVAGFIGTPQMNFFDVSLHSSKDKTVTLTFKNGFKKRLDAKKMRKIDESYLDGKEHQVIFGIRAEHLKLSTNGLKANVSVYEVLGSSSQIYASLDKEDEEVVVVSNHIKSYVNGDVIHLDFDEKDVHLFDKDSQNSILKRSK